MGRAGARLTTAAALVGALVVTGCAADPAEPPIVDSTDSTSANSVRTDDSTDDTGPTTTDESTDPTVALPAGPVIAEDLDSPWSIAFHGGVPLVSERDAARIVELDEQGRAREVAVIDGVERGGEGGLLGITVHEGHLFAYSTGEEGNRIERYAISGDPGALGLGAPTVIVDGIPAAGHHNGGRLAIGPDGMLYATTGDAGDTAAAQTIASLAGKILRMTPDGTVPADNPFENSLVYRTGHRNPQGLAWDEDGTLWASEFGQDTWDELNIIEAGANYGWPQVEGIADDDRFRDPIQQWAPSTASPSGIAIAADRGWIAALRGERLLEVPLDAAETSTSRFAGEHGRIRDVVVAPDGSLWVLTNNTDGRGSPGPGDDRILRVAPEA
jgi:glucose/arabinose dehydrogenase